MNNNLLKIEEMLMREMDRLNDDEIMNSNGQNEDARSNALSSSALTFLKTVNVGIRIMEISEKTGTTVQSLNQSLGIENEKKV